MMKSMLKNILIILSTALLPLFSANVQAQTPNETEACYKTYTEVKEATGLFTFGALELMIRPLKGDYSLRLYKSGEKIGANRREDIVIETLNALTEILEDDSKHKTETLKKSGKYGLSESDYKSYHLGSEQLQSHFKTLHTQVKKCDLDLKIPTTVSNIKASDVVSDAECVFRYAALATSFTTPAHQAYFQQRMHAAKTIDKLVTNWRESEEDYLKNAEIQGMARSKKNFNADGSPDFAEFFKSFRAIQTCDTKYGLPITSIPPAVHQGASGKLGGKK